MAKDAGAKGIIIITSNMENTFQPYSDYSDNTFLVFIADSKTTKDVFISSTFILGTITSSTAMTKKAELQLWVSTLNTKSYELLNMWEQTLKDIPSIGSRVNWKPRYALWGCNSGLFVNNPSCTDKPEYLSSCACKG